MRMILTLTAALVSVPTLAHAEPVTAAIFGAAFAASIPGAAVSIAISISASRAYSVLVPRS